MDVSAIWPALIPFAIYGPMALLSLLVWWTIYEFVLTPGLPIGDAVFGRSPNTAVAMDILGGFLALGILNYTIIAEPGLVAKSGKALDSWLLDVEATALTLLATIVLLGVLRLATGGFLRLWFRSRKDSHGQIVTFNNELFRQRNLATGLFSTSLYLILVAGLVEEDLLNISNYRIEATWNMLGVWLLGAVMILLHSWLYLGLGGRHHILHECFHDNNPAAATSLLGMVGGMLLLNHQLLAGLEEGQHMFNQPWLWLYLLIALIAVKIPSWVIQIVLVALFGLNTREELVERDNPAWGVLDGGLIFVFFLIFIAAAT